MKRKPKTRPTQDSESTADAPEYLREWAKGVRSAGKAEARLALAEYQRLATDKRVPKADRDAAKRRADALERLL
jgi:hypothetical protein